VRERLQRHGVVELQAVSAGERRAPGVEDATAEGRASAALWWVGRGCCGPRGRAVRGCKDATAGLRKISVSVMDIKHNSVQNRMRVDRQN
jgi:hypothetical protein